MGSIHLKIDNAVKYYNDFKAVDCKELEVKKGDFFTILGPSGSGKTTLLKLIAGFEELNDGNIILNGEEISNKKPYERNIGMLFQNYALFPHMTVEQNVSYPLKVRKVNKDEIKDRVNKVLSLVRLGEHRTRYPSQLSGGQQQRIALARAIVFNPPLLLLDEPLGALDKNLRHTMQLEIKKLQKETGITTISVTHDQEEALTMSDKVCVMNGGKIEQISSPQDIYNYPINKFVAQFIGEINLFKGKLVASTGEKTQVLLEGTTNLIVYASETNMIVDDEVYVAIRPENIKITTGNTSVENSLKVLVKELIFVGESLKVKVVDSIGTEITINASNSFYGKIQINSELIIEWDYKDAVIIPQKLTEENREVKQ